MEIDNKNIKENTSSEESNHIIKQKPKFSLIALVLIVVLVAMPGVYLVYRSLAGTTEVSADVTTGEEMAEEEAENGLVAQTASSVPNINNMNTEGLISSFNNLTISNTEISNNNLTTITAKGAGKGTTSNYEGQLRNITAGKGNYLYYVSTYVDPYVYFYQSLKNKNIKTVNVTIKDTATNKSVIKKVSREEYIGMAVNLMNNVLLDKHLIDVNKDGKKEIECKATDSGVYNCGNEIKGKNQRIQYSLYIMRAARSMVNLSLIIKQDSSLKAYTAAANKYVNFVEKNVIKNPYYKSEYNSSSWGSHHKSPFVNAHAIETLLNLGRINNNKGYINDAVKMAVKHRDATERYSKGKNYILVTSNSGCDSVTTKKGCYTLFQDQTRAECNNCQAADTSHMNSYVKMVLTFYEYEKGIGKTNKTFNLKYVNRLVNTVKEVMWKPDWIPAGQTGSLTGAVTLTKSKQNILYLSKLTWPTANSLKGKKVILSCPFGTTQKKYLAEITSNSGTKITINYSNTPSFSATSMNCNYGIYDAVQYVKNNPNGYWIRGQYSDFSNGTILQVYNTKEHDLTMNPKYAPGSLGKNFAEWIGLADYSDTLKTQMKNMSINSMSNNTKAFMYARAVSWK